MSVASKPTLNQVLREHGAHVRRTLAHLKVPAADLDDVAQEVFLGVARGLALFNPHLAARPGSELEAWLYGICKRQAANHREHEARRSAVESKLSEVTSIQPHHSPSPEDLLLSRESGMTLRQLVQLIHPDRRAVFVAYDIEGADMREVAAAQSIPVNTAWNRLRLARVDLAAAARRLGARRS